MEDKPIAWIGASRDDICSFPDDARRKTGFQLRRVQQGKVPTDFKPIPTVGKAVQEIRIRTDDAYRIFYVAQFAEAVYVLHAFQKKTQKTSKQDLLVGKQRFQEMVEYRKSLEEIESDE
jgi:phage-related protein